MTTTNYIWDEVSNVVLLEADSSAEITAEYTHLPIKFGEPICQSHTNSRFLHYDDEGSTRELTDATQEVTDTFTYSPFGVSISRDGTSQTPFQYRAVSQFTTDELSDLAFIQARPYDSRIGRLLTTKSGNGRRDASNYRARPASAVPNIRLGEFTLTMKIVTSPTALGNCGAHEAKVNFVFDADDETKKQLNGWIVQYVILDLHVYDCDTDDYIETAPLRGEAYHATWFEAWKVLGGTVVKHRTDLPFPQTQVHDIFTSRDFGEGTYAIDHTTARAVYIQGYELTSPPWYWDMPYGGVFTSGPALGRSPEALKDAVMEEMLRLHTENFQITREFKVRWNCCDCDDERKRTYFDGSSGWRDQIQEGTIELVDE